jgi:hypothetical protein
MRAQGGETGARKIRDWEVNAIGVVPPLFDAGARLRGGVVGVALVGFGDCAGESTEADHGTMKVYGRQGLPRKFIKRA